MELERRLARRWLGHSNWWHRRGIWLFQGQLIDLVLVQLIDLFQGQLIGGEAGLKNACCAFFFF
jgi:hypothetical protein